MKAHLAAGRVRRMLGRSLALSLVLLAPTLSSGDEVGSDMPNVPVSSASAGAAMQAPPLPTIPGGADAGAFDWVQMSSGEWLKGEFMRMHDDSVQFDSDEFDVQSLDWGDVATLVPVGPLTVRLPNKQVETGSVVMHNGTLSIDTGAGVIRAPQADVISITPGEQREINYWSGGASAGLSARSGNTDQLDVSLRADVMRHTTLTRTKLGYIGAVNTSNGATTANNHRVPASFDYFVTDRLFVTPTNFEYYTDKFSNIDRRITVGAGLGYEAFSNRWVHWEFSAGAAYQNTAFVSVFSPFPPPPFPSTTANDAAVVFSTIVELDLPRGIEWDNSYKVQVVVTDIDKTSTHAQSILSFDIWGPLEFEAAFYFDRIEQPQPEACTPVGACVPSVPKSNDYRLTFGLAVDY
jgi:hypothetical protein